MVALGGRVQMPDLPAIVGLRPDLIAVRSAVCATAIVSPWWMQTPCGLFDRRCITRQFRRGKNRSNCFCTVSSIAFSIADPAAVGRAER